MENQFPGNSHQDKENLTPKKAAPAKKVEKIVTGTVSTRKKPLGKKIKEFVVGDDSKSVLQYVWQDILVPSARDMVFDAFTSGVERKMYGDVRSRGRRGRNPMQELFGNVSYNAYNRYSASSSSLRPDPRQGQPNRRGRAQVRDLAELVFDQRGDATEVLDAMIAIADQYNAVTISDLWDLLGRTGEPTDENYGWTDLVGTDIYKVAEGYLLDLPRPHALD